MPRLKINAASLAVLAVFSLFLALVPVLMIQFQKARVAQLESQSRVDSVMWIAYQFEREHSRMRMALRNMIDFPTATAQQDLVLRYDIFFSRFDLMKTSPSLDYLRPSKEYRAMLEAFEAFIKTADPVLAGLNNVQANDAQINALLKQANIDEEALRDLTNLATNTVSKDFDARNSTIQRQGLWIFLLAGLQWLILLGSLVGFILYVRKQQLHNLELSKFTRRLHQASRKADSANQAKSVFLANMSHELRTPFQGLLGMLNLLTDTSLTSTQQEYANTALASARHLLGILNDILDISTIESGAMKLRLAPVHLGNLISEVEALMRVAADAKHLELKIFLDPHLPVWITADATRVSQILFNLLSNAIKFTDAGMVDVKVLLVPAAAAGEEPSMQISVRDTGVGIDAATLAGLFSRFHQADQSVQRRHGGTGLGLEISRTLARMMGGRISVESTLGVGTLFTVTLPVHAASAPKAARTALLAPQRVDGLRVLVADDHPVNSQYLSTVLSKMGHIAGTCENGLQAVQRLQTDTFDVILMDLHMPVMDGISATRAVRQLAGSAAATKIIMVSADILNDTRQSALEAGVDGFIAKPVQEDALRKALALCYPAVPTRPGDLAPLMDSPSASPTPSLTTADSTCVNMETYLDFVDLMPPETVRQQLLTLFGTKHNEITAISAALSAHNRVEAARLAHQLKGVCMLMGLTALARILATVEKAALATHEAFDPALIDQLAQDANATQTALQAAGSELKTDS
jgi:two-component system, sensor histidine kinase